MSKDLQLIVDLDEAPAAIHEAATIRSWEGESVYAVALCGDTFDSTSDWVRGYGSDERVTCPHCRRLGHMGAAA